MLLRQIFADNPFLLMALFAGLAASVAGGVIGTYVVTKRIVFISGSIAHAVLGGMGLALYLKRTLHLEWLKPIYGALLFAILAAFLIGWIHLYYRQREDTVIASLWTSGMALGVIFLSLTPGYNVEVLNFLFGNILWTSRQDLFLLLGLDLLIFFVVYFFHRKFLAICFDEKQALLQGLRVKGLYFLLLALVAITVVLLIQVVGVILVIAILSLPAAIANTFTNKFSSIMGFATLFGIVFTLVGISLSFLINWPPGATIALVTTVGYFTNLICKKAS
ncbi:metal ABC transporter permease [Candidatus Aerophobetes bacterium]|uniref:Metal ABC transporter permease n=1 Tax=Aerophobetes bacterium TaxID=2030807 RepID=A0A2A4YLG3_UNCAE|nr:MAG: metal ABC transporter permease [Candidatus Aerophobetes bacterium]